MEETKKTILWVEDFANDSDLVPDDYWPGSFSKKEADRNGEIKELFPDYLWNQVQVVEDPTELPYYMSQYGKNYEFIILDINFEVGISQDPKKILNFIDEMREAGIELPFPENSNEYINDALKNESPVKQPSLFSDKWPGIVKKLGYYLYWYLMGKWQIRPYNMIFYSGYCNEDKSSGRFDHELSGPIKPNSFDKSSVVEMQSFLSKRFSPDRITEEAAIVWAKDLFRFWAEKGIPTDSILKTVGDIHDKDGKYDNDIIQRIQNVLNNTDSKSGQNSYDNILREATFGFEANIRKDYKKENEYESDKRRWYRKVYEVLKCLRNPYGHRSTTNSGLSAAQFLLMFSVAMRAIFESTSESFDLQPAEKWLVAGLTKIAEEKDLSPLQNLKEDQLNVRIEGIMLQWLLQIRSQMHTDIIGDGFIMLCSPVIKYKYSLEDVVRLFCMRAMDAMLFCLPKDYNDTSKMSYSPKIDCRVESSDNSGRIMHGYSTPVPKPMESMAKAYILSQLGDKTGKSDKGNDKFYIYL